MDPSYNNSFGSFGANGGQSAQPILSPVGDASVLQKSQSKKNSFLKIGLFLILAAILLAVFAVVLMNLSSIKEDDYEARFNIFSNYLTKGNESSAASAEISLSELYYIDSNYTNTQYLDRLVELFDGFDKAVVKSETTIFEGTPFSVVYDRIDLFKRLNEKKLINDSEVFAIYKNQGAPYARVYVDNFYEANDQGKYDDNKYMNSVIKDDIARIQSKISSWTKDTTDVADDNSYVESVIKTNLYAIKSYHNTILREMAGENETNQ